jgi:hypothetical protein
MSRRSTGPVAPGATSVLRPSVPRCNADLGDWQAIENNSWGAGVTFACHGERQIRDTQVVRV